MTNTGKDISFKVIPGGKRKTESPWLYRVRLDFRFMELTCTRELLVRPETTLDNFHTMIQACGNWLNYHIYDFKYASNRGRMRAQPKYLWDPDFRLQDAILLDADVVTLREAFEFMPCLIYSYDYGDGWEILITLLGLHEGKEGESVPCCTGGRGAWPPDDVGGEYGLRQMLAAFKEPTKENRHLLDWAKRQRFEKYNRENCNRRLAHWQEFEAIRD